METHWLAGDSSADLAVYVVWSSQRGAAEGNVRDATRLIPDPRVRHYWDAHRLAGRAFAPRIGTGEPAWDVWMLFGPSARWGPGGPPAPDWWEDQLGGLPPDRRLDPDRFAAHAAALEGRAETRAAQPATASSGRGARPGGG